MLGGGEGLCKWDETGGRADVDVSLLLDVDELDVLEGVD
jgi:hypothetical protein